VLESAAPRVDPVGMSNCLLRKAGSPSVLAASRLALRATALGAATALTRPARQALCSSCSRHGVPACVGAVHPFRGVPEHGVKGGDHLALTATMAIFGFFPAAARRW
jgi:hypothetical protein